MHWITELPDNLQMFGVCSKSSYAVMRTPDHGDIVTNSGFDGSWGGDIGRYTH